MCGELAAGVYRLRPNSLCHNGRRAISRSVGIGLHVGDTGALAVGLFTP
jgi:hypothetical protein